MRLDEQKSFQYTLVRKFSVFGYSYQNTGINQSELTNLPPLFYKYRSYTFNTTVCTYI